MEPHRYYFEYIDYNPRATIKTTLYRSGDPDSNLILFSNPIDHRIQFLLFNCVQYIRAYIFQDQKPPGISQDRRLQDIRTPTVPRGSLILNLSRDKRSVIWRMPGTIRGIRSELSPIVTSWRILLAHGNLLASCVHRERWKRSSGMRTRKRDRERKRVREVHQSSREWCRVSVRWQPPFQEQRVTKLTWKCSE